MFAIVLYAIGIYVIGWLAKSIGILDVRTFAEPVRHWPLLTRG